jgi:hypothetical protein
MSKIQTEEAAQRLARAIAADLALYHDQKISFARGDREKLLAALAEELDEGRTLYESRVEAPLLKLGFFDRAIEEILIAPALRRSTTPDAAPLAKPRPQKLATSMKPPIEDSGLQGVGRFVLLIVIALLLLAGLLWIVRG